MIINDLRGLYSKKVKKDHTIFIKNINFDN
jgi:hypothetical protein